MPTKARQRISVSEPSPLRAHLPAPVPAVSRAEAPLITAVRQPSPRPPRQTPPLPVGPAVPALFLATLVNSPTSPPTKAGRRILIWCRLHLNPPFLQAPVRAGGISISLRIAVVQGVLLSNYIENPTRTILINGVKWQAPLHLAG